MNKLKVFDRHRKMLEYQKEIRPFTPTVRELKEVWGVGSTSVVAHTLNNMVTLGLVKTRVLGNTKREYYAIDGCK